MYNILENSATNRAKKSWKDKVHNERNSFQFSILLCTSIFYFWPIFSISYLLLLIDTYWLHQIRMFPLNEFPHFWILIHCVLTFIQSAWLIVFTCTVLGEKYDPPFWLHRFKQNLHSNDLLKPSIKWLFAGWKNGE